MHTKYSNLHNKKEKFDHNFKQRYSYRVIIFVINYVLWLESESLIILTTIYNALL